MAKSIGLPDLTLNPSKRLAPKLTLMLTTVAASLKVCCTNESQVRGSPVHLRFRLRIRDCRLVHLVAFGWGLWIRDACFCGCLQLDLRCVRNFWLMLLVLCADYVGVGLTIWRQYCRTMPMESVRVPCCQYPHLIRFPADPNLTYSPLSTNITPQNAQPFAPNLWHGLSLSLLKVLHELRILECRYAQGRRYSRLCKILGFA